MLTFDDLPREVIDHLIVPYLCFDSFYPLRYFYPTECLQRLKNPEIECYLTTIDMNDLWILRRLFHIPILGRYGNSYSQTVFVSRFIPLSKDRPEILEEIKKFFERFDFVGNFDRILSFGLNGYDPVKEQENAKCRGERYYGRGWNYLDNDEDNTYHDEDGYLRSLRDLCFDSREFHRKYGEEIRRYFGNLRLFAQQALEDYEYYKDLLHLFWWFADYSEHNNGAQTSEHISSYTLTKKYLCEIQDILLNRTSWGSKCFLLSELYISHVPYVFSWNLDEETIRMVEEDIVCNQKDDLESVVDITCSYIDGGHADRQDILNLLYQLHGKDEITRIDYYQILLGADE